MGKEEEEEDAKSHEIGSDSGEKRLDQDEMGEETKESAAAVAVDENDEATKKSTAAASTSSQEDHNEKGNTTADQKELKALASSILSAPLPPEKASEIRPISHSHDLPKVPPAEARVVDAKIRFQGQINPMPNPTRSPAVQSRPGAFRSHHVPRQNQTHHEPQPEDESPNEEEAEEDGREIAMEDNLTVVSGLTNDVTVQNSLPIAAELVEDHESRIQEMEEQLRKEFERKVEQEYVRRSQVDDINANTSNPIVNAVPAAAEPLPKTTEETDSSTRNKRIFGGLLVLLLVVVLAFVLGITLTPNKNEIEESEDPAAEKSQTINVTADDYYQLPDPNNLLPVLQTIQQRGYLKCEVPQLEADQGYGFTVDLCKALAAALFSNSSKLEITEFAWTEHFVAIHDGRLDVSAAHVSLNMERDVQEPNAQAGFAYSTPYLYTGTGLAGIPTFVQCAKEAETFQGDCRDLQVCVTTGTVTQEFVEAHLPGTATVLVNDDTELMDQFIRGTCNVMSADAISLSEQRAREWGYEGEYVISDRLLSHEHLALLTREEDPDWAQFCDWVVRALITAEALNITRETAMEFGATELFGPNYTQMFIQAIAAVGNYGEIYERNYGGILPRSPYNQINTGDTGLIVSHSLGSLMIDKWSIESQEMPRPVEGGTMETVYNRGTLYCGIILNDLEGSPRLGFAEYNQSSQEWFGMDVDYCRGIASAVGAGREIETVFVNVTDPQTRYLALENKTLDILAGEQFSILVDVKEPTTGTGFTFSDHYFYYNETRYSGGAALALATREDDPQWSDLVNWIVIATIHAEERSVTQDIAAEMPVVELFGQPHRQMFRDAIHKIGNYGEMYERNLARLFPRNGRNLLNEDYTPQFYPIIPFHA